jgi:hypothetical protein
MVIGDLISLGQHVKGKRENTSSVDCSLRAGENLVRSYTDV